MRLIDILVEHRVDIIAQLEENPEIKAFTFACDHDGNDHIFSCTDYPKDWEDWGILGFVASDESMADQLRNVFVTVEEFRAAIAAREQTVG